MTKRMEQSRRRGHHDPRFGDGALTLVPPHLRLLPDEVPQDPAAFIGGPALLKLVSQPTPLGTEERVQL
jgi:hypothetical protein